MIKGIYQSMTEYDLTAPVCGKSRNRGEIRS